MRLTTFLAFATGFVALSYEILWFRLISFISGGSPNAFGLLLASFLLGIALGSLIAKRYCGNSTETNKQTLLMIPAWVSLGIAVLGFIFPPLGAEFVIHWHYGWLLVFIIFISALMGAILPILSHYALLPNAAVGRGISWIYFFNILGATSGTLLTGFVLLDEFTFAETNALISTIGVCISFLFFIQGGRKGILFLISATLSSAFLILAMSRTAALYSDLWVKLLFKSNYSDKYKVTRIVENRSGVILVTKSGGVYGGGVYDGHFNTSPHKFANYIERAYVLSGVHPNPKSALIIGLGAGAWAQVIANFDTVNEIAIIEINPGYFEIIGENPEVQSLLKNPKAEFFVDDGRRWLNANPNRKFDLIVQNTTYHWRAHATNLLSVEYQDLIKKNLNDGGISMFNATGFAPAERTACIKFKSGFKFINNMIVSDSFIKLDKDLWQSRLSKMHIDGKPVFDLAKSGHRKRLDDMLNLRDFPNGWVGEDWIENCHDILARTDQMAVITDDNMLPEWYRSWLAVP